MFVQIRRTQPDAIIVHMTGKLIYIFYPNKTVVHTSGISMIDIMDSEKNWIIADADLPPVIGLNCRAVIVTSPKMDKYNRYIKEGFQLRCMPVWDMAELQVVHTKIYFNVPWDNVQKAFKSWGGVPRTVLKYVNDPAWNWKVNNSAKMGGELFKNCMKYDGVIQYSNVDEVSERLLHLIPVDDNYIITRVVWASQRISNLALDALIQLGKEEAKALILSTAGIIGNYGSLRGYFFERLAHEMISAGGEFQVRTTLVVRLPLLIYRFAGP